MRFLLEFYVGTECTTESIRYYQYSGDINHRFEAHWETASRWPIDQICRHDFDRHFLVCVYFVETLTLWHGGGELSCLFPFCPKKKRKWRNAYIESVDSMSIRLRSRTEYMKEHCCGTSIAFLTYRILHLCFINNIFPSFPWIVFVNLDYTFILECSYLSSVDKS